MIDTVKTYELRHLVELAYWTTVDRYPDQANAILDHLGHWATASRSDLVAALAAYDALDKTNPTF